MQRAGPSGWGAGLGCARHDDSDACNCYATPSATAQSLEELDFMRSACSAAQRGQVELLQRLLARNPAAVRSDGAGDSSGYTPLHYAARAGHVACVQLLLKHGAAVDARTRAGGATALHRAAHSGHLPVVSLLLEAGAAADAQDADGEAPLHKAAGQGHAPVAAALLARCPAASGLRDRHGKTPAEVAIGAARAVFEAAV